MTSVNMQVAPNRAREDRSHITQRPREGDVNWRGLVIPSTEMFRNELLSQINVSLYHTLSERNQCADFFAKLGASLDADLLTHASSPERVRDLLRNDAMTTFFLRK
ncbi:hypothetical protein TSUD_66620 [Trifolium subterraneum]|uniref:RNase H type-1 domain-containing protein n=1 Tax=Trifolium subterraneum TaxID=3900 RepID=A0A2Z6ND86_TRISU|nr:hypothetical protein TSUD_66620 [Trifolium subterraneum]